MEDVENALIREIVKNTEEISEKLEGLVEKNFYDISVDEIRSVKRVVNSGLSAVNRYKVLYRNYKVNEVEETFKFYLFSLDLIEKKLSL